MVSGPQALQIWADMSQVLPCEGWASPGPRSLHYFCNVLASQAYRRPPARDEIDGDVRALAVAWFEDEACKFWPDAGKPHFDWNILVDPQDRVGPKRIDAQVLRANVDPSGCCVSSAAGSTQWRMKTDGSGFAHLYLAGAWIDTGFNTECLEAAVMSGKQASRAICGSPAVVTGEGFLHAGGSPGVSAFGGLLRGALSALGVFSRA